MASGGSDAPLYIGMADTPATIAYSEVKSSDATLSSLTASDITFNEPFNPATTTYTATVETNLNSTTLAATAADAKASIAEGVLGEKALKMGLNTFAIPVTAEDGTVVTYTLNITVNGGLPTYSAKADFSSQQGAVWKYWSREVVSNTYTPLEWDAVNEWWTDGKGGIVANAWMHASADASSTHEAQMVLEFTCPKSGVVNILDEFGSIWLSDSSGNGAKLWIWLDNAFLLDKTFQAEESMELNLENIEVNEGQKIRFIVSAISGNNAGDILHIAPYIIYTSINEDGENDSAKPGDTGNDSNKPSPDTGVAFPLAVVSTLIGSGVIIAVSKKRRYRK